MPETTCLHPSTKELIDRVPKVDRLMHINEFNRHLESFIENVNESDPFTVGNETIEDYFGNSHEYFHLTANDDFLEEGADVLLNLNVHSNELIGILTADILLKLIKEHPEILKTFGIKNLFIYDADPEGSAMNGDALFEGAFDLGTYLENFLRSDNQPDFDYPVEYKDVRFSPDPKRTGVNGTVALLDRGVDVFVPLHNFGLAPKNVFWVGTHYTDTLAEHIPLLANYAELECSDTYEEMEPRGRISKGVHMRESLKDIYDQETTPHASYNTCSPSFDYLNVIPNGKEVYGIFGEPPYFTINKEKLPSDRRELLEHLTQLTHAGNEILTSIDRSLLDEESAFLYDSAAAPMHRWTRRTEQAIERPEFSLSDCELSFLALFYAGGAIGTAGRVAARVGYDEDAQKAKDVISDIVEYYGDSVEIYPLRRSVQLQLGTVALACLARKQGEVILSNYRHLSDDGDEGLRSAK